MRKRGPDQVRVPESRCLACGHAMNGLGTGDRSVAAEPRPGDAAVCIRCGAVMLLDDRLRLRGMTDAEMDRLTADREWMEAIARMVCGVHFVRHMLG